MLTDPMPRSSRCGPVWAALLPLVACVADHPSDETGHRPDDTGSPHSGDTADVAFRDVASGETGTAAGTGTSCAVAVVRTADDEAALSAVMEVELPGAENPSNEVDWGTEVAIVAYVDWCSHGGNQLEATALRETAKDAFDLELTLHLPKFGPDVISRPFTVIAMPRAASYAVEPALTVVPDDTG